MTQGYPVSSTIFNIVVNEVMLSTLLEICGPQEDYHGMVWATREQDIVF